MTDQNQQTPAVLIQKVRELEAKLKARDSQLTSSVNAELVALTNSNLLAGRLEKALEENSELQKTLATRTNQLAQSKEAYNTATMKFTAMKWFASNMVAEIPGFSASSTIDSHVINRIMLEHDAHLKGEKHRANMELVNSAYAIETPVEEPEVKADAATEEPEVKAEISETASPVEKPAGEVKRLTLDTVENPESVKKIKSRS